MVILIHVLTLSFLTYTLTTPWVRAYVVVNQTYYDIKVPIDIGVIKCYRYSHSLNLFILSFIQSLTYLRIK